MADLATNEYLNSEYARKDENGPFSAIGKQMLSLKLENEAEQHDNKRVIVVDEIESLCMENDSLLPANLANNEIQPGDEIQERGSTYIYRIDGLYDLERQLIKSDTAVCRIENIDLEVPAGRGCLTNVEGIFSEVLRVPEAL